MKDLICEALHNIGFAILQTDDERVIGEVKAFGNGVFIINISLIDDTFNVAHLEENQISFILRGQTYESQETILYLLEKNKYFKELVLNYL